MIEYPKRGEIHLCTLPAKPNAKKKRSALIVSLDVRNRLAADVIVVPLSTNMKKSPTHVILTKGEGGLLKDSAVKCEQITTIDKALLLRGPLSEKISEAKMKEVERAIMVSVGLF